MSWIKGSLRNGMIACVGLPLAIASVLAGVLLLTNIKDYREARYLSNKTSLISGLGALVHEQQKERGATSVFLSSGGTLFGEELRSQRKLTDQAAASLLQTIASTALEAGSPLADQIDRVASALSVRDAHREQVDAMTLGIGDALGHYTVHNADMLNSIKMIGSVSSDTAISVRTIALAALLSAKEFAGIERAIGSGGFAQGQIDYARALRLRGLISRQDAGMIQFQGLASPEDKARLAAISELEGSQDLLRYRTVAFQAVETGDVQGITADAFFGASTERINAFKALEDHLVSEIEVLAGEQSRATLVAILLVAAALAAAFFVATALTIFSIRHMLRSVRAILNAGDQLAKGDLDAKLPSDSPAELGRIVWSINFFRESVEESRSREAAIVEQRRRAEAEARAAEDQRQREERDRAEQDAKAARNEQHRMEAYAAEMSRVVAACATGDFSQKLPRSENEGALADISDGMNRISEVVETSLTEIRFALGHLAKGDMTYRMTGDFEGVFGEISVAMTDATRTMAETIEKVVAATGSVSLSAKEISGTTSDLAQRSERNAAMLQQTATSIDGISKSIGSASEAAQEAKDNVAAVSTKAREGATIAQNTMSAMRDIQTSSDGIAKILGVIDDIAFQTNLLALNAGVEAARAGDAGRGFAVVASEVRALAQRSSDSSREITQLIEAATQSIDQGVKMVDETVGALNVIATDMQGVEGQIEQIAGSFEETRQNVGEISSSTAELDQTTQQTAAMLEEANAAVQLLDDEARGLNAEVGAFRTHSNLMEDRSVA